MTKKFDDIELYKKAAEFALKQALKNDKKELSKDDKERLKEAIQSFFNQYDKYLETH
jgi:hypothetical protein